MPAYKTIVKKVSVAADMKIKQKDYLKQGKLAIVDQGQNLVGGYSDTEEKKVKCNLPVIVFGDHTRCVKYVNFPFVAGADGTKILESSENVLPKYLFYGTQYLVLKMPDKGYARHYQHLEKMDLLLPSICEQERIVSRIEEMFLELDSGIEVLNKIKKQLAAYRQAVLQDSFSNLGCVPVKLQSLIVKPRYGTSKKCDYEKTDTSLRVFRIPNIDINTGCISSDDIKYAVFEDSELKGLDLQENDLLLIRSNGSKSLVGRTAIVSKKDIDATFAGYLIRIRLNNPTCFSAKYLHYYLESHSARNYIERTAKSTSGVHNINAEEIKRIELPWCSEDEQKQIVYEIDSRLSVSESMQKNVDVALQQSEALRQSILKQAFEGGL